MPHECHEIRSNSLHGSDRRCCPISLGYAPYLARILLSLGFSAAVLYATVTGKALPIKDLLQEVAILVIRDDGDLTGVQGSDGEVRVRAPP